MFDHIKMPMPTERIAQSAPAFIVFCPTGYSLFFSVLITLAAPVAMIEIEHVKQIADSRAVLRHVNVVFV